MTTKNTGTSLIDGSSYEKAIKVNSVAEEYEYVGRVCSDCQLIRQLLAYEKNKYFDVITMKKPNGEIVSYYFDITEFYGKKA